MKSAGLLLLASAGLAVIAAAEDLIAPQLSSQIKQTVRSTLPAYVPPSSPSAETSTEPITSAPTPDKDVLILPKLRVTEKRLPSDAADYLMSRKDYTRKMENLYLDTLEADGPLNYLLNRFTIPILSPSKFERGQAIYRANELKRLQLVYGAGQNLDAKAAKKFKQDSDNTHTTRPAGGK